ncbi:hypothetical protein NADFUDRAFT_80833 [Nadsonia fulvescens var. elongata DSM 6958]|uniref:Vacuolar protein sorting-associated protein n=1 Tax=Nadsonia fulvescens var. elongata DSM 6958 TaxID=857566 RepID=A0A1E3PCV6_9ASCO|nr:hypothetical protein NADFUDRAFT_80833 [Nadsonia fulvescens var. elongata DSM 6958]
MLESLIASLLNRVLGSYVNNFDPQQLNIGIWSGDVKLRNLDLKREALDKFDLPIDIIQGHLGQLTLQIPWSNLKGKPVKVIIEDCYLLAEPKSVKDYNEKEEQSRAMQVKSEKLESMELIEKNLGHQMGGSRRENGESNLSPEEIKKNQSFTESLVNKIVDNVQITIKNIHVRYEDSVEVFNEKHPFSIGLTLQELSAVSTNSDWQSAFITNSSSLTYKLVTLDSLAIYWITDSESIKSNDYDIIMKNFKNLIISKFDKNNKSPVKDDEGLQYILRPITGSGKVMLNKAGVTDGQPRVRAQLSFDEIGFVLDEYQYRDILWTVEQFQIYAKSHHFRKFRPKHSVKEDPKAWIKYAGQAVLNEIHEKNKVWSWDFIKQRRDNRLRYIELYTRKFLGVNPIIFKSDKKEKEMQTESTSLTEKDDNEDNSSLSKLASVIEGKNNAVDSEQTELSELEKNEFVDLEMLLSFEDLWFYRTLAKTRTRREFAKNPALKKHLRSEKQKEKIAQEKKQKKDAGWMSWVWGAKKESTGDNTMLDDDDDTDSVEMTDEQRQELYDAIEWDERAAINESIDVPRDRVMMEFSASLRVGGFCLRRNPKDLDRRCDIANVSFKGFRSTVFTRPDSFLACIGLKELSVYDGTDGTLYKNIVSVKDNVNSHYNEADKDHDSDHSDDYLDDAVSIDGVDDPYTMLDDTSDSSSDFGATSKTDDNDFFWLSFESNPLNNSADSMLYAKMKSMNIIYNPKFLQEIIKFFQPPTTDLETFGAIMNAAGDAMEGLTTQTRIGLEYALNEHKTINLKLDLQAPLIVVPVDVSDYASPCAIIDAGHISVSSNLVDKTHIDDFKNKSSKDFSDKDWEEWQSLMYDKFNLQLVDTQILVGPNVQQTLAVLRDNSLQESNKFHILNRISLIFLLEISILPQAINLSKFKISGQLPQLKTSISDIKYKVMMQLIDVFVSGLDSDNLDALKEAGTAALADSVNSSKVPRSVGPSIIPDGNNKPFEFRDMKTSDVNNNAFLEHLRKLNIEFSDTESVNEDDSASELSRVTSTTTVNTTTSMLPHSASSASSPAAVAAAANLAQASKQKMFEFNFRADEVKLSLFKCVNDNTFEEEALVDIKLEGFQMGFYTRLLDMHGDIVLSKLEIEDYIQTESPAEFRKLLTSNYSSLDEEKSDEDLVKVQFTRTKRNVESKSEDTPEIYDMDINVFMSALKLVVTQKSILSILDFIITTFTTPEKMLEVTSSTTPEGHLISSDSLETVDNSPAKIDVNVSLKTIKVILNDDGIRLATLKLDRANVGVFLVEDKMKIHAHLGDVTIRDDVNEGSSRDSVLRQLVSIEGDELFDLKYETFPASDIVNKNLDYNSSLYLRSGSIKVNFIEEPFKRILRYLSKFAKMKAIYDSARVATLNQTQIEDAVKMKLDILIKTPILVFPKLAATSSSAAPGDQIDSISCDLVTANLGEIFIKNNFITVETPEGNNDSSSSDIPMINSMQAGIRSMRLTSDFYFDNDIKQSLEMIDNLDLLFDISYLEPYPGMTRPSTIISASLSEAKLRLTELQFKYLLALTESVPAVFSDISVDTDQDALELDRIEIELNKGKELPETLKPIVPISSSFSSASSSTTNVSEMDRPTFGVDQMDFSFHLNSITLSLYVHTEGILADELESKSLTNISLNDTGAKLKILENSDMESEIHTSSFTIHDCRKLKNNKFTEIIPPNKHGEYQFMGQVSIKRDENKPTVRQLAAVVTVDTPQVILALDYLADVKAFVAYGFSDGAKEEEHSDDDEDDIESALNAIPEDATEDTGTIMSIVSASEHSKEDILKISVHANIVDASIILVGNPENEKSDALVLKMRQCVLSYQETSTLSVNKVGMFLCQMHEFEKNRLRVLDDFSMSVVYDAISSDPQNFLSKIKVSVEPLILRLSIREVMQALNMVQKFSDSSSTSGVVQIKDGNDSDQKTPKYSRFAQERSTVRRRLKSVGGGFMSGASSMSRRRSSINTSSALAASNQKILVRGEKLNAEFEGFRFVVIGIDHELPILDINIKSFITEVNNWSSNLIVDTGFQAYINVFNYRKSAWEPFIEPWNLGVHISKDARSDSLSVNVFSRELMELTVTSQTIGLLSKATEFFSNEDAPLNLRPEELEAPYRILNQTGYDIQVWIDEKSNHLGPSTTEIADGHSIPWRFHDWKELRENLNTDNTKSLLGIKLLNSPYSPISAVSATNEGESLFLLKPKSEVVYHRLVVDVKLGLDNVKSITIRSGLNIVNKTKLSVDISLDGLESSSENLWKIPPGGSYAIPIKYAYDTPVLIRPEGDLGFKWSSEKIVWKNLLKSSRSIGCENGFDPNDGTQFYFQAAGEFQENEPLAQVYPHMNIILSAPIEIENLLPFDMSYRIYDKSTKKDWVNFLRKGDQSPVHVVMLSHLLMLCVQPKDSGYSRTDFAIINAPSDGFKREKSFITKSSQPDKEKLQLKLHYTPLPGGAYRVSIFSPYLILNKTGLNIQVKSKYGGITTSKVSSGESDATLRKAVPKMFSFHNDDGANRASIKIGDSEFSQPVSFDAVGSVADVAISSSKNTEMNIGVAVTEGEGKYKLTKVVTLTPRYILRNNLDEDLQIRHIGLSTPVVVGSKQLQPIHFLKKNVEKQLTFSYTGSKYQWSAPFNITEFGRIYVKLLKPDEGYSLLLVHVLLEQATVFLHVEKSNEWPYSIRNFTKFDFVFYQENPYVDANGNHLDQHPTFNPLYYKIPAKSVMRYSWDYPAAPVKELIIAANKRTRHIQLAEIGNLKPLKLPATESSRGGIVDINVVADGPTQTLVLSDYDPEISLYKLKANATSSKVSLNDGFDVDERDSDIQTSVAVKLEGIGISLINHRLQELCYITLRGFEMKYNESDLYQTVSIKLKWIQIDNQLFGGVFPIILFPSVVPKSGKEMENHPTFSTSVTRVKDDSHGVLYIKYFTVLLQELTVEMDEDFIFALIDFTKASGATWVEDKNHVDSLCDQELPLIEPTKNNDGLDIYFETIHIQPTQMNLSFVRTEHVNAEDATSTQGQNTLMFFLNILTMAIGNINDAPVRLNALIMENVRTPLPVLAQAVSTHYSQDFFNQIHLILGSADFLGNPVGLFNNLSSGFMDIFYEPYQGFIMNDRPQELGISLAKGGVSFVQKSVFSISDSISKVTGSISKGLSVATMDKSYQDRRRMQRSRNKPAHALYGFSQGANSFFESIASGVTGIASAPVEGAVKEGASGFFKGVGKGLLGLPTKTAIGFFDLATNVSEGIKNTAVVFNNETIDKLRPARYISYDGIVRPYSQREAMGQTKLKELNEGAFFNETYLAHVELSDSSKGVMLSFKRIMLFSYETMRSEWEVKLCDLHTVTMERTGISLILRGNIPGPFIPISETSVRRYFYSKICVAVNEWNMKYEANI